VNYFLFDTKGKNRGGNGTQFDWSVLNAYPFSKPFFLSGGIGPNDAQAVKEIKKYGLPIYAVDINSKFEDNIGLKNSTKVINFKNQL
jgi:phosphoribosylanthranilate isomerase